VIYLSRKNKKLLKKTLIIDKIIIVYKNLLACVEDTNHKIYNKNGYQLS